MLENAGFWTWFWIVIGYIFVGAQVDLIRMAIQKRSIQPQDLLCNDKTTWLVVPFWPLLVIGFLAASPVLFLRWIIKHE